MENIISTLIIPGLGAISLGSVTGWLVRSFLWRFEKFNLQILSGLIGIISGGALSGAALVILDADTRMFFAYFIGLPIGFIWYKRDVLSAAKFSKQQVTYAPVRIPVINPQNKNRDIMDKSEETDNLEDGNLDYLKREAKKTSDKRKENEGEDEQKVTGEEKKEIAEEVLSDIPVGRSTNYYGIDKRPFFVNMHASPYIMTDGENHGFNIHNPYSVGDGKINNPLYTSYPNIGHNIGTVNPNFIEFPIQATQLGNAGFIDHSKVSNNIDPLQPPRVNFSKF